MRIPLYGRLSSRLRELGLSQSDLAYALGLSPTAISLRMSGKIAWDIREMYRALEVCRATFRLEDISYLNGDKTYVVSVRTDKQSYGDVTPYQVQIESLNAAVAQKDTQLTESEENLAAANAQLAELEATYDAN